MDILNVIQAIAAGICFYAGIVHLIIGWRSDPKGRMHLIFAAASLLFGALSIVLLMLDAAVSSGLLDTYPIGGRADIYIWYPLLAIFFLAFVFVTGLRLSGQIVEAEKEIRRLDVKLEGRTAELSASNRALQKAEEQIDTANRSRRDFLVNLSQELLTPLTTILGFSQLMERDQDVTPRQIKQLESINHGGEQLLDTIKDALESSQLKAGNTFDIAYETGSAEEIELDQPERRVSGIALGQQDFRILVTSGSIDNRLLLQQIMESVGFEVWTAANRQEAVDVYNTWQPHLIWMDTSIPVMDGCDAARQIKESDGSETVIIALTTSTSKDVREKVLDAGCDDIMQIPFKEAWIFDTLAEHLGIKYVYSQAGPGAAKKDRHDLETRDLAPFPKGWLEALRGAALRGSSDELTILIMQIRPQHPAVAGALQAMVTERAFKQIVTLAEAEEKNGQSHTL